MPKPRLLVLASTFQATTNDGTPSFVRDLAQAEAVDFDTLVLVPAVPGGVSRERIGQIDVERFRYFPRRWEDLAHGAIVENLRSKKSRWLQVPAFLLAEWWAVHRAVRRFQPDVMHVHWVIPQGAVARGAMRRVPSLITTLGGDLYGLRGRLFAALKRMTIRRAVALTAMNLDMRERLIDLGAAANTVHVVPMGADLTTVRAESAGMERIPGRILAVGRLVQKKGIAVLVEAVRKLPTGEEHSVVIVGDGPLRPELERAAGGLNVSFLGQLGRRELAREYARSDLVVVPSVRAESGDQDGLPVVLLEAMGAGSTIVASDLPGLNEAVINGRTGVLVPAGDADALAAAICERLADSAGSRALGAAAAEVADSYSVDAIGRRYRELLHEAMSQQKATDNRRGSRR